MMQDSVKAKYDRAAAATRLDNAMTIIVAALSAVLLFAMICATPPLPPPDVNPYLFVITPP